MNIYEHLDNYLQILRLGLDYLAFKELFVNYIRLNSIG